MAQNRKVEAANRKREYAKQRYAAQVQKQQRK